MVSQNREESIPSADPTAAVSDEVMSSVVAAAAGEPRS
jgi:hypothetical protein